MPGKYFLDTNIFVYAFDKREPLKGEKSIQIISKALQSNRGVVSFQVIQEFTHVALQKFAKPLKPQDCKLFINNFLAPLCEIYPSMDLYNEAINIRTETGLGFYDSLIVASAIKANAQILYSEDLNDGQTIRSLTISNPYR